MIIEIWNAYNNFKNDYINSKRKFNKKVPSKFLNVYNFGMKKYESGLIESRFSYK